MSLVTRPTLIRAGAALLAGGMALTLTACGTGSKGSADNGSSGGAVKVGLITKTDTNPFFVKMKEGAQKAAQESGATLSTASRQVRRRQRGTDRRDREHGGHAASRAS